jgi:hypothetical protein
MRDGMLVQKNQKSCKKSSHRLLFLHKVSTLIIYTPYHHTPVYTGVWWLVLGLSSVVAQEHEMNWQFLPQTQALEMSRPEPGGTLL